MALLSRRGQLLLNKLFYTGFFGLTLGGLLWLSFFRVVQMPNDQGKAVLIVDSTLKVKDQVVFHYPDLGGPLRLSVITKNKKGRFQVQIGEVLEELDETLVVGVVKFRF